MIIDVFKSEFKEDTINRCGSSVATLFSYVLTANLAPF